MAITVTCPECDANLKLAAELSAGQKVKCPKCSTVFAPRAALGQRVSSGRPVVPPRPRPADDEDELDREERRPRRPVQKQGGSNALLIGLVVGGGVLVLLLVMCAGVAGLGYWLFRSAPPSPPPVAVKGVPVAADNPAPFPPAVNPAAPQPGEARKDPAPAAGGEAADPPMPGPGQPEQPGFPGQPPGFPPAPGRGFPPMPGPGAQPGNQPANGQFPMVLSNPKVIRRGARMEITVDYKWVQGGPRIGQHVFVIIKSPRSTYEASIFPTRVQQEGTFDLSGISFGIDRGPFEIYAETGMPGQFGQRQRLSASVKAN
jgi:predicted Zn finger-like uncharacterized protein